MTQHFIAQKYLFQHNCFNKTIYIGTNTATTVKQSPVLKVHLILVLS